MEIIIYDKDGNIKTSGDYKSFRDCVEKNKLNLTNADLRYAYLKNADLESADLRYAYLTNADLESADLTNADLESADLINAYLENADLRYAYLENADLTNADLRYAYLTNANLTNADLTNADLRYAYLTNANLTNAYLRHIKIKGSRDLVLSINDHVWIGCICKHIEYWKLAGHIIGKENDYTESEIDEYRSYIYAIDKLRKTLK